jgi:hypothetical protein
MILRRKNMSVLAFNIGEFTKKTKEPKYALDKIYAVTLDPDMEIDFTPGSGNNRIKHHQAFIMNADDNGTRIRANDATMWSNPIESKEPVMCRFMKQVYRDNCSVVFFKFVPEKLYTTGKYPDCAIGDPLLDEAVFGHCGHEYVVKRGAKSNDYIITDDIENIYDITASDAVSSDNLTFTAEDINDVKFVAVDDDGKQTEIATDIVGLASTCAKIGVVDKDGNFIPLAINNIDIAAKQKMKAIFAKRKSINPA